MELFAILAAVGLTIIITKSFLFEKVRELPKNEFAYTLIHCPQCMGFWCGLLFAVILTPTFEMIVTMPFVTSLICEILEKGIYE